MKEKALFISHWKYLDPAVEEGGVRMCTLDYIQLIQTHFDLIEFPVEYNYDLLYSLRVKLGINAYDDYKPGTYTQKITDVITRNDIKYVFLNLANTMTFATEIRKIFKGSVKIVLCSHGNESGDFFHEVSRFKGSMNFTKRLFAPYILGRMLLKEGVVRQSAIDLVLTVSEVEREIENWIGARNVMLVPRTIIPQFVDWNPVPGRIGFFGNLSHWPNINGFERLCEAISEKGIQVEIRLLGSPAAVGKSLAQKYPFVKYLGFLELELLIKEAATWNVFLNPVFYYSRGVSTKLAKALTWGLPVITTHIGFRGYSWTEGKLLEVKSPEEMAEGVKKLLDSPDLLKEARNETVKVATSSITFSEIGDELKNNLLNL